MKCRFCNSQLDHQYVDLCNSPIANEFLSYEQLYDPETFYPLKIMVCSNCFLVQIDQFKLPDAIFNNNYAYFSSVSKSWVEHAREYTEMITDRFGLNEKSFIIEIASNDGYLLQHFKAKGIPMLGIEPSSNVAAAAAMKGIPSITEYFGSKLAAKLAFKRKKANLVIGNNVIAHVPKIDDFVEGLKRILRRDGVITLEFPHLLNLIKYCEFDTIYHEHFSYISLFTLNKIFNAHHLEIFDVEKLPTHGGSLRVYGKHLKDTGKIVSERVQHVLTEEIDLGLANINSYLGFQERVDKIRKEFIEFLIKQKDRDKKVIGYGAAAKGNTFLNYCGVKGTHFIQFIVDASPFKQGKYLPGSHIPVMNEAYIREYKPDYIIIFPWNIKEEIMEQLSYVSGWGCRFVTFIPEKKIYLNETKLSAL